MEEKEVKSLFIKTLEKAVVKTALKKILGSAVMGGFKAWLIKFIATELFEHVAEPVIRLAIRKGQLIYDKTDGNLKLKKIREAKDEDDTDTYWDTIGDI